LYFSNISSGSVGYSIIKSSSIIEVDIIGFLNFFEISLIILLSGIRIPTVFLLLNIFGILFVPFKIILKGPGKILFNNLKVRLLICLAYLERLLKSKHIIGKLAFFNLTPFILAIRSNANLLLISHPKA